MLDVCHLLVLKKDNEEGPDIRGGDLDALIVHATRANKNGENPGLYINYIFGLSILLIRFKWDKFE